MIQRAPGCAAPGEPLSPSAGENAGGCGGLPSRVTSDEILLGLSVTVALAVGAQILAAQLRVPALIVLLPAGFAVGALTGLIDPLRLLGAAFPALVALAVAVILYEAGLGLDLRRLTGHPRRVVRRLLVAGVPITWASGAYFAAVLLDLPARTALLIGVILVVSGPTVVGPLLDFVRPRQRVRQILTWEGSLIDPIGAILAALVFHAVVAGHWDGVAIQAMRFLASVGVGLAGGALGAGLVWLLLRALRLGEILGTLAQLATVVVVAAACNVLRDDTGLIAAIVMGLVLAVAPGVDIPVRRPFLETLVRLIVGLLFISIAATVTPVSVVAVLVPTLGLVAVLVLITRPLVAAVATVGTDLTFGERLFIGWMAPRGIVAASTASAFAAALQAAGIPGAGTILPVTFVVIVATVAVYGLTAAPVARLLGVGRPSRTRPLLVGGDPWVVDLGRALRTAGLDVLMWAGGEAERARIRQAGLAVAPGELLAAATGNGKQLEGITAVLLLTVEDDFNALASRVLPDNVDGPVYRLAPPRDNHGIVAPYTGGAVLFGTGLNRAAVNRRFQQGHRVVARAGGGLPAGCEVLFLVRADGQLVPVTADQHPEHRDGDTVVIFGPVVDLTGGSPAVGSPPPAPPVPGQRAAARRDRSSAW